MIFRVPHPEGLSIEDYRAIVRNMLEKDSSGNSTGEIRVQTSQGEKVYYKIGSQKYINYINSKKPSLSEKIFK